MLMEKITTIAELRLAIQVLEYQRTNNLLAIQDSLLQINRQLTPIKIIKYVGSVILDAWLPFKSKQLALVIIHVLKFFGKRI